MAKRSPDLISPMWALQNAWIPPEHQTSLNNYMSWVLYKRKELENLIKTYRTQLPMQIKAYRNAAMGEMNLNAPKLWGQMHTNLQQRGLDESPNFLGGARQEWEQWKTGERQQIADTAKNMRMQGQQAMLAALGQPNYAGQYQGWTGMTQRLNEYLDNLNQRLGLGQYER